MIGPALLEKLIAVYARWLDEDELGMPVRVSHDELPDLTVTSVREFLEELIRAASGTDAVIELPVALKHPDSTFGQLLASSLVTHLGPPGSGRIHGPTAAVRALLTAIEYFRDERPWKARNTLAPSWQDVEAGPHA